MSNPTRLTKDETLFRQIHPTHRKTDGSYSAEAFTPSKHDLMLSTLRESVGPEEANRRWREEIGSLSDGTWGISVTEINRVEVECDDGTVVQLQALDDAEDLGVADHASIDFTRVPPTRGKLRQAGRKLLEAAIKRGRLFPTE